MSLEDEFSDVIAKAMRGLGTDVRELAESGGVSVCEIEALLGGGMNETSARAICPALGLDAEALIGLPGYLPLPVEIAGVRRIELPFGKWIVNVWEIGHGATRLLIDAGFGETDLIGKVSAPGLDALLITHAHPDHIGGMAVLAAQGVRVITETEALAAGSLVFGALRLEVIDLSGHCTPAAGYLIHGLERPVLVVGDAIFAGSMGGCKTREAHQLASTTLRAAFAKADPGCVILPGHGPATTVAEELVSNPFRHRFAAMEK